MTPLLVKAAGSLFFLTLSFFTGLALKRLFPEKKWVSSLRYAFFVPSALFASFLTFTFFGEILIAYSSLEMSVVLSTLSLLRSLALTATLTWSLLRWKTVFQKHALQQLALRQSALNLGTIETLSKCFTIATFFLALLLTLRSLGLDISILLTFSGIGVAAFALATKDILANLYGGFMIHVSRSFTLQDFIELPQKKISGTVEHIGWYFTTIRDIEKNPLYVPNAIFSTEFVINPSRRTHRMIEETLHLRFDPKEKTDALVQQVRELLLDDSKVDKRQPIYVHWKALGPASLQLQIRAYTTTTQYGEFLELKHSLLSKLLALLQQEDALPPSLPLPLN